MPNDISPPDGNLKRSESQLKWGLPRARTVLAIVSVLGYILITGGFFAILFSGDRIDLPEGDVGKQIIGMLGMIVGTWNAALLMMYTFHFGSSQGSNEKNEAVRNLTRRVLTGE